MNRRLAAASIVTLDHIVIGMVLAIVCAGIVCGVLRMLPKSSAVVNAILAYLRAVPAISVALLAFSMLDRGQAATVFGVAYVSFFPIVRVLRGVRSGSARFALASAVREAFPAALGVAIAAEIMTSAGGLGSLVASDAVGHPRPMAMMLDLFVIGVLGAAGSAGLEYSGFTRMMKTGETKPNRAQDPFSSAYVVLPRPSRVHWACGCISELEGGSEIKVWPCTNHDDSDADVRGYLARARVQSAVT